ncbi:hypothetical protein TWF192_010757 [Orbilia oligospora]|uniref:Uncharacterized protein n=1 Tax=Orbilia oligospora TaxID=2813651 RepID=A0A6G1LYW0_ORBOL|nr:hypothetical protein TWF191_005176 [Orbilia oligospora]KAF3237751.1 hypothetical protein TWF192_010757 [Orbilia oligospora]
MLFSSKAFLISTIALAAPSLAALNWDQTLMTVKLAQMGTADITNKPKIDGITVITTNSQTIQNNMQNSINDQAFVISKGQSGGPIQANMPLDASAITSAFNSWAPYHTNLINSLKAKAYVYELNSQLSLYIPGFRQLLIMDLATTIGVSDQLRAMMPGSGYATARANILATANVLCKAQKQAITAYGGTPTGGANTCA